MTGPEQLSFDADGAAPRGRESGEGPGDPSPPTAEQAAAIDSRDRDVFLEAGAGTGKTRVLVDRYCDAIDLDELEPEQILAITFTEKAAAEMRRRVRVELMRRSRASDDGERRRRLLHAARSGEGAQITTIHGFCRRLLAANPAAAGLDPRFRVLAAEEAARLARLAFERALDGLARADGDVAAVAAGYRQGLEGLIRSAYDDLRSHGQRRPALPPLQIAAFEGLGDEPPDPADVELADRSYRSLQSLLVSFGDAYERVKAERSGVDFDDLQLLALELLQRSATVASAYRERYLHLLVDEFQDTSPLQVRLVQALQGSATRLFTVGDEFQSIYAFRGADLASFREERELVRAERGIGTVLPLSGSFRSTPEIVAAVNALGHCLLEDFRELRVGRRPDGPPPGPAGPTVDLLLTQRGGWKDEGIEIPTAAVETEPNRTAEARFLARRLRELADSGVTPGSMVLLLRAFTHVDAYAEALDLAGLDPYVVGGRGYWSSQQVEDALRLLACVANPLEDEALFGALASPACGASPDSLWLLRQAAGPDRHLWPTVRRLAEEAADAGGDQSTDDESELERRRLEAEWLGRLSEADLGPIGGFARRLKQLRSEAQLLPLDSLVEATLERFDYDLAALAMPGGGRRAANLLKLIRLAGEYEAHEGRDLRGFLSHVAERAALSDREAEATVAAEGHDGVTVMTVHAAKGLEFDCVAVADLGRRMAGTGAPPALRLAFGDQDAETAGDPDDSPRVGLRLARAGGPALTLDGYRALNDDAAKADAEEAGRLAYVAASRARQRLILSGMFEPIDVEGGHSEPRPSHSVLARLLPRLAVSGEDGELVKLPPAEPRTDLPGETAFEPVAVGVRVSVPTPESAAALAFDLRAGSSGQDPAPGGRPPLLALGERGGSAARSLSYAALAEYDRCGYRFLTERVLGLGAGREATAFGVAAAAPPERRADEEIPAAAAEDVGPPSERATSGRGSRLGFGRAVHALLERSAREGWRAPEPATVEAKLAREGAAPELVEVASGLVSGWLASPLLAELIDAGARLRPELPFRLALGRDTVVRGTIDLLAEIDGQPPLVIDYKTDAALPAPGEPLADGYMLQRALYALAVAKARGAPRVRSAYVFLSAPDQPVIAELDGEQIGAGQARIEQLIGGIRERRFEATEAPHRGLCHDCPARRRLCPHPLELTGASESSRAGAALPG
jgi:ATP-dependent exoDNAse (exonuclease V) beta subunit